MTFDTLLQRYAQAVYNKDVEGFVSVYDSNVCIYDTWNEWESHGTEAVRAMATGWFESLGKEKVRVEFTQVEVFQSAHQTVWVGAFKFDGLSEDDEILRSISNRWTWVIKESDEGFKVVHEHSSLPVNMETFKGIMKAE